MFFSHLLESHVIIFSFNELKMSKLVPHPKVGDSLIPVKNKILFSPSRFQTWDALVLLPI